MGQRGNRSASQKATPAAPVEVNQLMNEPVGERQKQGDQLTGFGASPGHDSGGLRGGGAAGSRQGQWRWERLRRQAQRGSEIPGVWDPQEREAQGERRVTHPYSTPNVLHSKLAHVLIKTIFPKNLL